MRPTVRLVCWKEDLASERARLLEESGFQVDARPLEPSRVIGHIRECAPAAVLIDLDRLPSHGREVAVALRQSKATRQIPIVFAGGVQEKTEKIRQELPDAFFAEWATIGQVVEKALREPVATPVKPPAHMERYASTGLAQKLGVKAGMTVTLLGAPDGFLESLGDLPETVRIQPEVMPQTTLAIWFVRSRRELADDIEFLAARLPERCSVWIVHPKQSGRYRADFNQNDVREIGLQAGLVDYKVCSVDADWSGLKFARKKDRQ